jgi:uncharacterized protein YyaL (SSP411 family)
MMIAAMARCAETMGDPALLAPAAAADFSERQMSGPDGLRRTWRAGKRGPGATVEDYAWLLAALAALARRSGSPSLISPGAPPDDPRALLDRCQRLYAEAAARFADPQRPGHFYDAPEDSGFFVRVRSTYDGATPNASSGSLSASRFPP